VPRRLAIVAIAGFLTGGIVVAARVAQAGDAGPQAGKPYVSTFAGSERSIDLLLASGDGQFYAAVAQDPTLSRPEVFPSVGEAAYRAARPLLSYLAWAAALGADNLVGVALAVLVAVSCGLAAWACAQLADTIGANPSIGLAVLVLPGSLATMHGLGGELLALALTAFGLVGWLREPRRPRTAVAFFALAGLARETTLVVPVVLAVREIVRRRPRSAFPLVVAPLVWAGWLGVVRLRLGEWPDSSERVGVPFAGFIDAVRGWENPVPNIIVITLAALIVILVAIRARSHPLGLLAMCYVPVAIVAGPDVWHAWENFSRPLLPLFAFGLIALAPKSRGSSTQTPA
jgi:hypothetical protein